MHICFTDSIQQERKKERKKETNKQTKMERRKLLRTNKWREKIAH